MNSKCTGLTVGTDDDFVEGQDVNFSLSKYVIKLEKLVKVGRITNWPILSPCIIRVVFVLHRYIH